MTVERKPRVRLKLQIVYDDGQSFMSGPVLDLSESGVFIETVMPLSPGTAVRLTPLLADDDAGVLELEGEVVRKADYDLDNHFDRTPGMGIRFVNVGDAQREAIAALVARGTKKPGE
jgi:uncharacterized protein (TIGR02266 family)